MFNIITKANKLKVFKIDGFSRYNTYMYTTFIVHIEDKELLGNRIILRQILDA